MTTQAQTRTQRVWSNPSFVLFWGGQGISVIGSSMATIALPILVFQTTHSVAQMGLVSAASGIGSLVASLFSGLLVDRVNRRRLLIICDSLNVLMYASIPIVWFFAGPQITLIYALAPFLGFFGITFFIGYSATVTNLVAREQLTAANSALQGTAAFAGIIGPVLAGVIATRFGAVEAMTANAFSFIISVTTLSFVRLRPTPEQLTKSAERPGWISAFLGGFRFIASHPTLRWMVIIRSGGLVIASGAIEILLYRMQHDLGLSGDAIGLVFGAGALGAVLSSIVVAPIRRRLGFGFCFLGGTSLVGLSIILYGLGSGAAILIVAELIGSFGSSLVVINTMSLRHELTPDNLQGRVTAFLQLTIWVLAPVAVTISTAIAAQSGAAIVLCGMGSIVLAFVLIGTLTPVRTKYPERASREAA